MLNISDLNKQFFANAIHKHKLFFLSVIIFVLSALIYISVTPKVYLVSSRVAIFRIKFEDPDHGSDDSRNRWIWVRDGLNINSAVVNDVEIKKFYESNEIGKLFTQKISDESEKIRFIRSFISVTYTGGDESNYIIDVKSFDPRLSFELNKWFFNHLKYLALQKDEDDFSTIMSKLEATTKTFDLKSVDYTMYKNKIAKMKFEQMITQTQKERAYQIISAPAYSKNTIWPKKRSIMALSLLLGVFVGFIVEYAYALLRKQNS